MPIELVSLILTVTVAAVTLMIGMVVMTNITTSLSSSTNNGLWENGTSSLPQAISQIESPFSIMVWIMPIIIVVGLLITLVGFLGFGRSDSDTTDYNELPRDSSRAERHATSGESYEARRMEEPRREPRQEPTPREEPRRREEPREEEKHNRWERLEI